MTAPDHPHEQTPSTGILLVNLGTPDAPTGSAVRRYLAEFLSDPRVIELPKILWRLLLYGLILPFRSGKSAKLYQKIWTPEGSPLLVNTQALAETLKAANPTVHIEVGMSYGNPALKKALDTLHRKGINKLIVLPLFPQYSATTAGSVFDAVTKKLQQWRRVPTLHFIDHYADHPAYIRAIATQINTFWQTHEKPDKLIFSFHGIPQRYFEQGDPYPCYCRKTARLVAENLQLPETDWQVVFQSRFGKAAWVKPYCEETLATLASAGTQSLQVICPGFSVDCLETLEEINLRAKHCFLNAGGKSFAYIPALNATESHTALIQTLLAPYLQTH